MVTDGLYWGYTVVLWEQFTSLKFKSSFISVVNDFFNRWAADSERGYGGLFPLLAPIWWRFNWDEMSLCLFQTSYLVKWRRFIKVAKNQRFLWIIEPDQNKSPLFLGAFNVFIAMEYLSVISWYMLFSFNELSYIRRFYFTESFIFLLSSIPLADTIRRIRGRQIIRCQSHTTTQRRAILEAKKNVWALQSFYTDVKQTYEWPPTSNLHCNNGPAVIITLSGVTAGWRTDGRCGCSIFNVVSFHTILCMSAASWLSWNPMTWAQRSVVEVAVL